MASHGFGFRCFLTVLPYLLLFTRSAFAQTPTQQEVLVPTIVNGEVFQIYVPDNRKPALYTGDYGDCLGSSAINVTRFDASYYSDNMTVVFHVEGHTSVKNDSILSELLGLASKSGRH